MFDKFKSYLNTTYDVFDIGSPEPINGILLYKAGNRQCQSGTIMYIFGLFGNVSLSNIKSTATDNNGNIINIYLYTNSDIPAGQNHWFNV